VCACHARCEELRIFSDEADGERVEGVYGGGITPAHLVLVKVREVADDISEDPDSRGSLSGGVGEAECSGGDAGRI
jgi:hypothetical protein